MIKKYLKIWWILTSNSTQTAFQSRFGVIVFLIGKILRVVFFLFFLFILISKTNSLNNYSLWQVIFFYATFNLVDSIPQFFLREVYRFRFYVITGKLDYLFLKPFSALFRALLGGSDVLDLSIIALALALVIYSAFRIDGVSILNAVIYILLLLNAIGIALAFHIGVLALGILTTEVDNSIMLYRDMTQMGRLPVDIYKEPLHALLTFAIPVGIMMTFPAKAMMGLLSFSNIIVATTIGTLFFLLSIKLWKYALKKYASASS